MAILTPGQGLTLSEAQLAKLGPALHERVQDSERDHSAYFRDISIWDDWIEGKPKYTRKDTPFANASNVIVPVIKTQILTLVNRLTGMVFGNGNEIWMARTENTEFERNARDVVRWLNWAANGNDFDFRTPITDWLSEIVGIGSGVIALNWRSVERTVAVSMRGGNMRTRPVSYARGPLFEHVPRQQILWNTRFPIAEAPMVVREAHLFWSEINQMASVKGAAEVGWIKENVEKIQHQEGLNGPSAQASGQRENRDRIYEQREPHDLREVHIDWPSLRALRGDKDFATPDDEPLGRESASIVVTYHYKTGLPIRCRVEPYNLPGKPFFDGYYRKQRGKSHGVGLAKDLFAMQDAITVLLNQGIDSRTRANSFWAKTDRRELISKVIDPRYPVYVPQGATYEPLKMEGNVMQDLSLINFVNIIIERLTGQADPVMGRESRSGGHPSPATSTLALLGQSDQMIGSLRMMVRSRVSQMGEAAAILYQQFETNEDGRLQRILGTLDAKNVEAFLFPVEPIPGNILFDVQGMSQTQNPQQEMAKWIQITQMNVNYWSFVSGAIQQVAQAQQIPGLGPMIALVGKRAIEAQTKLQERLLEAGNVDDIENFTLSLQQAAAGNSEALLGVANELGQLGGGAGVPPQLGPGGPPAPPGRGALATPGGFGPAGLAA